MGVFLGQHGENGNIENSLLVDFVQKVQLCAQKKKKIPYYLRIKRLAA